MDGIRNDSVSSHAGRRQLADPLIAAACRPLPAAPRCMTTRQIFFPPSSETSRLPSGSVITPTGRPHTSLLPGAIIHPVRKSVGGPDGLPLANGT